jgi:hypothetical protein
LTAKATANKTAEATKKKFELVKSCTIGQVISKLLGAKANPSEATSTAPPFAESTVKLADFKAMISLRHKSLLRGLANALLPKFAVISSSVFFEVLDTPISELDASPIQARISASRPDAMNALLLPTA